MEHAHKQAELTRFQDVKPSHKIQPVGEIQTYIQLSNSWLLELIEKRIAELKTGNCATEITIPKKIQHEENPFKNILDENNGDIVDFTLLTLSLCSKLFDIDLQQLIGFQEQFPEIGGVLRRLNHEFVPTVKTALFLLCGNEREKQALYYRKIASSPLFREEILDAIKTDEEADFKNAILRLNDKYLYFLSEGIHPEMGLSPDFPAQSMKTSKGFNELIIKDATRQQLEDIILFARFQKEVFDNEQILKSISKGFIGLFWGPPGTGKSLTAAVIAKEMGIEAFRIDLSRLVSKYIGETEKNLERVFQRFDGKNCLLFFDEADALFGKRSDVKDAKDRYANQEISYLLQRVESFGGLVILASNLKENMDEAFKRRILSWVYFPRPNADERHQLWKVHLPKGFHFESEEFIRNLAENYELTGSHIANVVKLSCFRAMGNKSKTLTKEIIEPYIIDIYKREGLRKGLQRPASGRKQPHV